jgi:RNase P/RNase MRP subunit p29
MSEKPIIKARYRTVGPKTEMVTYTKASIDPETKSMDQKQVTEEMETFMVYFPQGHSIRILGRKRLEEMGYHLKPKMVDMKTGEVVDYGGDPYDFANPSDEEFVLSDDDDLPVAKSRAKA